MYNRIVSVAQLEKLSQAEHVHVAQMKRWKVGESRGSPPPPPPVTLASGLRPHRGNQFPATSAQIVCAFPVCK